MRALHEDEVEPASELETHCLEVGDALEPETLVESQGCGVLGVDAADHDVLSRALPRGR
jgi:hypothetical protein